VPGIFIKRPLQKALICDACEIVTEPGCKYIVNVGSVGQPRDADPRACFSIYDTQSGRISLHRAAYDPQQARAKILQNGLPEYLGDRLLTGH
jgi:diadenosine tetraphosphatase ApaH/serine/threonine PP2A family protein phosphatase